jgi:hypothetical protein
MHSVKNRFLMRIKNATPGLYRRCWLPMTARDLVVILGCVFFEPKSLPAFWQLAKCWRAAWQSRREIMRRRRVSDAALVPWFQFEPASHAAHGCVRLEWWMFLGVIVFLLYLRHSWTHNDIIAYGLAIHVYLGL